MAEPKWVEPRRLLLSWRAGLGGLGDWIHMLKLKLKHEARGISFVDVMAPGEERRTLAPRGTRADDREWQRDYSDLLVILTIEYVGKCESEPDHELLYWAEPLRRGERCLTRLWAVQTDASDPACLNFERDGSVYEPWASPSWHLLPSEPGSYLDTGNGNLTVEVRAKTSTVCIKPIRDHLPDCAACDGPDHHDD